MLHAKTLNPLAIILICCQFSPESAVAQDLFQWQTAEVGTEFPQRSIEGPEDRLTTNRNREVFTSQERAAAQEKAKVSPSPSKQKPKFSVAKYTGPLSQANQLFTSAQSDQTFQASATLVQGNDRQQVDSQLIPWEDRIYTWSAPNFYHRRLYFEQVNLERYGVGAAPAVRPAQSSLHFYGSLVLWPVNMIRHRPSECEYSLGHQRPGDAAAYQH